MLQLWGAILQVRKYLPEFCWIGLVACCLGNWVFRKIFPEPIPELVRTEHKAEVPKYELRCIAVCANVQ